MIALCSRFTLTACIRIKTGIQNIDWFCCRILGHLLWSGEIGRTDYARNLAKYLRFIKPLSKPDLRFPLKISYYLVDFIFIQIYLTSFHYYAFLDFIQSQKMLNVNIFDIWTVDVLISTDLSSVSGQHYNPSLSLSCLGFKIQTLFWKYSSPDWP